MSIFTFMASGVYLQTDDRTGRAALFNSTPGGIVFEADQGPVDDLPTLTTSQDDWFKYYGFANPQLSPAHDCALAFHNESSILYNKRQINGALWAGATMYVDRYSKAANDNGGDRVKTIAFPAGMETGYKGGARDFDLLAFGGDLITGNSFTMTITDGVTIQNIGPVAYATSHQNTIALIVSAINTALASFGNGGTAQPIQELSGNPYLITLWAPTDTTLSYSGVTITGGSSQCAVQVDGQARLMEIFADNPGDWANDYGFKIVNVDPGVAQRNRLIFSGPLLTGQTFSCVVNGTNTISVPFNTDSDTTMAAIATALQALTAIDSAVVQTIPGAVNNDRVINTIASVAGPDTVVLTNVVVTGTGSLPVVTVQTNLTGIAPTGEMRLQVYSRDNVRVVAETFLITLARKVNTRGTQTAADNVINLASGRSAKIKVIVPDYARSYMIKPELVNGVYVVDGDLIKWMSGGDDGAACTSGQIADGWDAFTNRTKIASRLLINGGYTNTAIQQKMIQVAEDRYDAMAILDIPSDQTATQDAVNYRLYEMNIDSSYGALYSPWLTIQDEQTDEVRDIPPSGHVAAVYAYSERTSTIFHAPAGLNRGLIKNVVGLTEDYSDGDRELLEPNGINPIVDFPGIGPAVFGEETLQYAKSILSSVHARRLLNLIQVSYADQLKFDNFDPANEALWYRARQAGEKLLKPFKNAGGIVDYEIVCDIRNNGDDVRDDDGMQVWVYLKITPAAKRILLKTILLPTGASFSVEIANDNNASASSAAA